MGVTDETHTLRQAFWLSYSPAEQESIEEVFDLFNSVVFGAPGFMAGEVIRDGRRMVDTILFTPKRQRVTTVCNPEKWKRKGAQGKLEDVRWPAANESVEQFLLKWAEAISSCKNKVGTEE